ncbi:DUF4097 family beta strand repeat-containing protein [Hymenobacter arizonensis]|uniref:Adhesin domain-containing protein n=1 Tax=Hymenobacter arizonensis TaxID=1227077 RepID=A0A1I5ZR30_HYMAR|nr:hypothetical protein [Hymenobacter arizonensis]SFQ58647.1 hypothetical protein SAMN04515668_3118 [Hymenobacter arizonensis]
MTRLSFLPSLSTLLLLLSSSVCWAQSKEFKEQISKEFTLTAPAERSTLALYNIHGSVEVQGYSGNKVIVEATKIIRANDAKTLEEGKAEATLGFLQRNDSVIVYMAGPFDSRPRNNYRGEWNHKEIEYRYEFDYVVKVPYQLNLRISTVNQGSVQVQDVTGPLNVSNVNGPIKLANVKGTTKAHTVNGNVEATYAANPPGASSYKTINGQIKVKYPSSLGADMHFKSMHGEFYTDFANAEMLPVQVTKNKEGKGGGTVYKITKETAVRIGKGGPDFRFETLNGNVTVSKK